MDEVDKLRYDTEELSTKYEQMKCFSVQLKEHIDLIEKDVVQAYEQVEDYVNKLKKLIVEEFDVIGRVFFKTGEHIGKLERETEELREDFRNVAEEINKITRRLEDLEESVKFQGKKEPMEFGGVGELIGKCYECGKESTEEYGFYICDNCRKKGVIKNE